MKLKLELSAFCVGSSASGSVMAYLPLKISHIAPAYTTPQQMSRNPKASANERARLVSGVKRTSQFAFAGAGTSPCVSSWALFALADAPFACRESLCRFHGPGIHD